MNEQKRPLAATIVIILMGLASIWWLSLAFLYFFGAFWFWIEGIFGAWFIAFFYGLAGFFGLGITAGLQQRLRQAYNGSLIVAIIFLIFSLPAIVTGYGIGGLIISGILFILLLMPGVKAYFKRDYPAEFDDNVTSV